MVEDYNFYYPKMQKYLNAHNLLYSAYILYLYSGIIWADEYMLGALGRMFDVKISVVSPAYDDVWNIFHESGLPHVVIVANGGDFGKKHGTLFSHERIGNDLERCLCRYQCWRVRHVEKVRQWSQAQGSEIYREREDNIAE